MSESFRAPYIEYGAVNTDPRYSTTCVLEELARWAFARGVTRDDFEDFAREAFDQAEDES